LFTLVDLGVMLIVRWWRWRSSYSLQPAVALMMLVVLRWSEPKASGARSPKSSPIKLFGCSRDLSGSDLVAPLLCHHGGGADRTPDEAAFSNLMSSTLEWIFFERNTR
jgi:hypothetical protein